MRRAASFLLIILISYIVLVVYTNRALFFSTFDAAYWQDKYEHSQWKLPLSSRIIGDDGLYLYEGYRLIHGGDPTVINAEMPPVGKYAIGLSVAVFGNGYVYGFMTTAALLLLFFLLTKSLTKNPTLALAVTVLLAADPLITSQFPLTMLDSIQTTWLLAYLLLLFRSTAFGSGFLVFCAGLALGLFAGSKFPILAPLLYILGLVYLWRPHKNAQTLAALTAGAVAGYLLPYSVYFVQGHSIISWLKVQKWMLSFYLHGNLIPTWGSALVNLLIGKYQNIFSRLWETSPQWSPSWTALTLAGIAAFVRGLKPHGDRRWTTILLLTLLLLVFYAVIPFWTRYLVLLLPLLYLAGAFLVQRLPANVRIVCFSVFLIGNLWSSVTILFPTPEATVRQLSYNWEHMFFHDMYEDVTRENRHLTRDAFRQFAMTTLADGEIEHIAVDVHPTSWSRFVSPQTLSLTLTYYTRNLGTFTEEQRIPMVKEDGRWRIPWQWEFLFHGLTTGDTLGTTVVPAKRGSILASDKKPMAEDIPSVMIWVTPDLVDANHEEEMYKFFETLFEGRVLAISFHQRVAGNSLLQIPVPIGVVPHPLTANEQQRLASYPGVTTTPAWGRINHGSAIVEVGTVANTQYNECCSWLYSTTMYDGVTGVEKAKNAKLKGYNGGTLVIRGNNGNIIRTLLTADKSDGTNTEP